MNNIFEGAYFGKAYRTRDGRKAIYLGIIYKGYELLLIEGEERFSQYTQYGHTFTNDIGDSIGRRIVSEWQEEINEDELDSLAYCYACEIELLIKAVSRIPTTSDLEEAYKAGYRQAKEE